jgi:hypothetical protein
MELSPSCEAASRSATQEFPKNLWNPKFHYRVHNSPPLVPILDQINPVHSTSSYLSKIHLILSSHLCLGLPSSSFLLAFSLKPYTHSSSPHACYIFFPFHLPLLGYSNYIWQRVQSMNLRA